MDNKDKNIFSLSLDIDFSSEQKISDLISKYNVRVLYLGENRNGSYFTKEVVDKMLDTLGGVPVIGHYDAEKGDFLGHGDLRVIVTEDGDVETKKVGPVPYGFIPLNPRTWWEKRIDKDSVEREYLCTEAYLWTGRYDELSILKENKNNQSMELNPETSVGQWTEMESGFWYVFTQAEFIGLCILGQDVEPCFEGAGFTSNFALDTSFAEKLSAMKEELQFALNDYKEDENEDETEEENAETNEEVETEEEEKEVEPTEEELEQIEQEAEELDPEDLNIDSSIDETNEEDYMQIKRDLLDSQLELTHIQEDYAIIKEDYATLKAENEALKEELGKYKEKELNDKKFELLEKYSTYIPQEKLEEIKENISDYDLKELDTLAVTTAFEYMKEIMVNTKTSTNNKNDFTILEEEDNNFQDIDSNSWQAAVLKKQKQMKQGG